MYAILHKSIKLQISLHIITMYSPVITIVIDVIPSNIFQSTNEEKGTPLFRKNVVVSG